MLDFLKRFFGHFDSNGLKYSTKHLKAVYPSIINWSVNRQAMYADAEVVKNCNIPTFQQFATQFKVDDENMHTWNATSIGNIAYMAIHSNTFSARANCLQQLLAIKNHIPKLKKVN